MQNSSEAIGKANPAFVGKGVEIIVVAFINLRGVGWWEEETDLGSIHAKTFFLQKSVK